LRDALQPSTWLLLVEVLAADDHSHMPGEAGTTLPKFASKSFKAVPQVAMSLRLATRASISASAARISARAFAKSFSKRAAFVALSALHAVAHEVDLLLQHRSDLATYRIGTADASAQSAITWFTSHVIPGHPGSSEWAQV
jgi:hypothetical protein